MVAARYIVFVIGASFSTWCVVVAALTLAGKNVAAGHLTSLYPLAYSAIYLVISPVGISGVLGALNRKTSLIKGFIFQYWISALLLTAMNIFSTYWAHSMAENANRECQTLIQGSESPINAFKSCTRFIKTAQLASLIFTCGQGGVMFVLGILLTLAGLREAEDIKIDEETSSLLDKATYDAKPNNDLTPLRNVHRSNSDSSHTTNQANLSRNTTNASSNYNQVNLLRNATNASSNYNHANLSRNTTNASSNYNQANLSRNTTNASNSAPNRQNMNNYNNGFSRTANNPPLKYRDFRPPQPNTNVGPSFTPNYIPPVRNQVSPPGHVNDQNTYIYTPPPVHTKVVQPQNDQYYIDDYQNYWQPTVAKNMATDLTRNGLY